MHTITDWPVDDMRPLALDEFDCSYVRYRLQAGDQVRQRMIHSLRSYGQLAPVVIFLRQDQPVLVDGFKRHDAARESGAFAELLARRTCCWDVHRGRRSSSCWRSRGKRYVRRRVKSFARTIRV